jgi:hypothetical protein
MNLKNAKPRVPLFQMTRSDRFNKAILANRKREAGSSLFIAMTICLVVGLILSGYLVLTSNRFQMTVRSQDWNATMPVLEAGIEEALTHLKVDSNAPAANNWILTNMAGVQAYTKDRTFEDGSYYHVYILNYVSSSPLIYSLGFVRSPYHANQYITRTVQVGATNPPIIFTHAVAANGQIKLGGNGVVDAFDSRLGAYDTATNRLAGGGLATNAKIAGAISVGSGDVYGPVSVGAGGTVTVGNSGAVGDVAWIASHNGIESNFVDYTMNVAFPSNFPPTALPPPPSSPYTNVTSGSYSMASYSSSGDMIINGDVTLYVTGSFTLSGQNYIKILPGGSLTLILGGDASMKGGGVQNGTGVAGKFTIIGLNSCTSIVYAGSAALIATMNAPQAAFTLGGTADCYGAIIANSANFNGSGAFHYDTALAHSSGFVVTSWKEL